MPADRLNAITLHQPWATLIAIGAKTIETRSWPAPRHLLGTRIAIHAGRTDRSIRGLATRRRQPYEHTVGGRLGAYDARVCVRGDGLVHQLGEAWLSRDPGDGGLVEYVPLPFGAVVCTARLAMSVPMYHIADVFAAAGKVPFPNVQLNGQTSTGHGTAYLAPASGDVDDTRDLAAELPYGFFAPGRWAWVLADVEPLDPPVPADGAQGIWRWTRG